MCVYIYIYVCVCIYIYIYKVRMRDMVKLRNFMGNRNCILCDRNIYLKFRLFELNMFSNFRTVSDSIAFVDSYY